MSDNYVSPPGLHRHRCHWCHHVWEHPDTYDASHNAVEGSHECLACGKCNWQRGIYDGPEPPAGEPE